MNLSLFAGSGFHKRHGAELARHGLAFVPVAHPFSSAFPDGRWLGASTDLEATMARIAAFSERDAATWRRLVAAFPQDAQAIFALLGSPVTMRALASFSWKTVRSRRLPGRSTSSAFCPLSPLLPAQLAAQQLRDAGTPRHAGRSRKPTNVPTKTELALVVYSSGLSGEATGAAEGNVAPSNALSLRLDYSIQQNWGLSVEGL